MRLRERAGLSRAKFVRLVGLMSKESVSVETLRRHESNMTEPTWSVGCAYANLLGVKLEKLQR